MLTRGVLLVSGVPQFEFCIARNRPLANPNPVIPTLAQRHRSPLFVRCRVAWRAPAGHPIGADDLLFNSGRCNYSAIMNDKRSRQPWYRIWPNVTGPDFPTCMFVSCVIDILTTTPAGAIRRGRCNARRRKPTSGSWSQPTQSGGAANCVQPLLMPFNIIGSQVLFARLFVYHWPQMRDERAGYLRGPFWYRGGAS